MKDYYARTICCLFYNVGEIGWSLIQFTVANLYIIKLVRTFSRKWCLSEAPTLHCPRISSPSLLLHLAKGVRGQRALQDLREGMGVGAGTEHSFQHLCSKKGPLLATAANTPYPRTFSALSLWRDFLFFFFFFWERVLLHSRGWPWVTEISCLPSTRIKCLHLHLWHYQGFLNWQHG